MVKKLGLLLLGLLLTATLILVVWYRIDGIPIEETEKFMSGAGFHLTEESNGDLLFRPTYSNGHGIVIMHGALIQPQSYAKSAAFFAKQGYTVYLPNGPGRLSVGAVERAAETVRSSNIEEWFFIGHSMGGMASMEIVSTQGVEPEAIALWATAMPRNYRDVEAPILYIWGDTDGLLPIERMEISKDNLPTDIDFVTLKGANHKNFAMYSHQFFDREATIDWMEQIDFANETTADFFAQHL